MTGSEDFEHQLGALRTELIAHCYRMTGSLHEAEDLVQETYLRAWRSYGRFEGRSPVRTWLYRIATNVCLTAIERRSRRPLPAGLGPPSGDPDGPAGQQALEVPWLEPIPTIGTGAELSDPASVAAAREGLRLGLVAGLQYLSAKQRAVLILRDVLEWPATEANGQPAFDTYQREPDGAYRAHALQVLTITGDRVARIVIFLDPTLFPAFALPAMHGAASAALPRAAG